MGTMWENIGLFVKKEAKFFQRVIETFDQMVYHGIEADYLLSIFSVLYKANRFLDIP